MQDSQETETAPQPSVFAEWLTRRELAQQLALSTDTLARWRTEGVGPTCIRVGSRVYYRLETVRTWLLELERRQGGRA